MTLTPSTHRLTILPEGVCVPVWPRETMLSAIRRAGFTYRFGCQRGGCGMCRVHVVNGDVTYECRVDDSVLPASERQAGSWLSCRAVLNTDAVIAIQSGDRLRRVVPFEFAGLAGPAGY